MRGMVASLGTNLRHSGSTYEVQAEMVAVVGASFCLDTGQCSPAVGPMGSPFSSLY